MKRNFKKIISLALVVGMIAGILPSAFVSASTENGYADSIMESSSTDESPQDTRAEEKTSELTANLRYTTEDGKVQSDADHYVRIDGKDGEEAFHASDNAVLQYPGDEEENEIKSALKDVYPDGYDAMAEYNIFVEDKDGQEYEPDAADMSVSLYLPEEELKTLDGTELYHIKDWKAEKLDYSMMEETESKKQFVSFETDSFSPFVFVKKSEPDLSSSADVISEDQKEQANDSTESEKVIEEQKPEVSESTKPEPDEGDHSDQKSGKDVEETPSEANASAEEIAAGNLKAEEKKPSAKALRKAAAAANADGIYIRSLSTQLFYGATRQDDGTYVWNVPETVDGYKSGHHFNYRINFSISGVDKAPVDTIHFTVPKSTLKDRDGNAADTMDWSIPSRDEVEAATDANGNIDPGQIDNDINYAYYEDGDHYIIYNFREIPAGDNGYIELSYVTSENSFQYADMRNMTPFTCTMTIDDSVAVKGDADKPATRTTDPITTAINTTARITSTYKQYPYGGRVKTWDSAWGNSKTLLQKAGYTNTNDKDYYYLVWNIRSYIVATQPYNFQIDDDVVGNYGDMKVVAYRFAGNGSWQADNHVENQTLTDYRWDAVVTAIPLSSYQDHDYWEAKNTETATVTPFDKVDDPTSQKSSVTWNWTKPHFTVPTGHFYSHKWGDDTYRANSSMGHSASSLDFRAGNYSRYDLEKFNGYDPNEPNDYNAEKQTSKESYGGFDYASWVDGYPTPWTRDSKDYANTDEPWAEYNHKPVRYQLTDEGIYLGNDESVLQGASTDGHIDGEKMVKNSPDKAAKLGYGDYKIDKLQFSWYMRDAEFDNEETGSYQQKAVTYTDNDVLTFEGKFNGSDDWVKFGTYNIKTGKADPVSTYVKSMDGREIDFVDGQDLMAYRVTTANEHYYTEIFTVPFVTLKNSDKVTNLLAPDGKPVHNMVLVNSMTGDVKQLKDGVEYHTKKASAAENEDPYQENDYTALAADDSNWTDVFSLANSSVDFAEASESHSSLRKSVVSTQNNVKKKYYTITWKASQSESGTTSYTDASGEVQRQDYAIPQESGVFYDLLPEGSTFVKDSVQAVGWTKDTSEVLPEDEYTVSTVSDYHHTGRTMVVIVIKEKADRYDVTFDTRHSWNSIKDFGTDVYNPIAYETGNDSITGGMTDSETPKHVTTDKDASGSLMPIADSDLMANLASDTGVPDEYKSTDGKRFIYADNRWDIAALTSASSGLMKKVKAEEDPAYSYDTRTHIGGNYSYAIRYMNSYTSAAKNMILFDSLENYDRDTMRDYGKDSDWHGTVQSIDVSQMTDKGIDPVIYISTKANLDPETDHDVSDTSVWEKVTTTTDLSKAKAIAFDIRKTKDGKDFVLNSGDSVLAYVYMKAPSKAPDAKDGESYPYAYNNIYISDTVFDPKQTNDPGSDFLIHQDYTKISLVVTGSVKVHKTNSKTERPIQGITFRLFGKSDYGTDVDVTQKTDKSGNLTFKDIEKGKYTLQETDATEDYLLDPTEHSVVIDAEGHTTIDGKLYSKDDSLDPVNITDNPRVHTDIQFSKRDANFTATKVAGAVYRLSGKSSYGTDVLMTATSEDKQNDDDSRKGLVTFRNVEKGTYTMKEVTAPDGYVLDKTEYTVTVDDDGNYTIHGKERDVYGKGEVTAYSHTSNISDDGTQNSNYGSSWSNSNIRGTGRDSANSQAHVITIPGADKLHVKITWGGESASYDWVSVWAGSHPDYTASGNNSSGIRFNSSNSSYPYRGGGGSHTSTSNTKEFDVDGDSVTFGYRSDGSGSGDGYGYYAVVTGTGKVKTGTTTEAEREPKDTGTYILMDEPLHYITFTKKSSYDNAVIGGAEFSLTGVSDSGNSVEKTAVSEEGTGTVRFDKLESGSYILKETKAPDGYEKDENKYALVVKSDGSYTISGLTKDKSTNIYDFYDTRKQDKQITITKIWNDGQEHNPTDLAVTIQTGVVQASQRTYTIKFDANGGTYGSGADSVNTLTYNAKNEVMSGTFVEPAAADENHGFVGWSTNKNATSADDDIKASPNDLTNSYLNQRTAGSTTTLYAVYKEREYVYYAVSPYGIETDDVEGGGKGGITFGPATGNMFSDYTNGSYVDSKYEPMLNAHKISDSTYLINDNSVTTQQTTDGTATDSNGNYVASGTSAPSGRTTVTKAMMQADMDAVQPEGETAITTNRNAIVGDDAGTDADGNAYRCIHYDNWNTIMYWNDHDPHVYDKCVKNHCSKQLVLRPTQNMAGISWNDNSFKDNGKVRGDGGSRIGTSNWDKSYDSTLDADDMYSASLIRARLVGTDRLINPNADWIDDDAKPASEGTSAFGAWPKDLRDHIGAKALYDTNGSSKNTSNTAGPYYDKLWLFDYNEIFSSSNTAGSTVYSERGATGWSNATNGARGSRNWWWLRSRRSSSRSYVVDYRGYVYSGFVGSDDAVAPGFTLSKSA